MSEQIILHLAIFVASFLQGAIGIGFGVIAGPVVLIVMDDGAAIQVSIILSFVSAIMLAPAARKDADTALLKPVFAGSLVGAPLGIALFGLIGVGTLKLLAAAAVAFMALVASGLSARLRRPGDQPATPGPLARGTVGIVSGLMNTALAMPGPVVAAFMSTLDSGKLATRATTLVLFVLTYPIAYAFQWAVAGRSDAALALSLWLAPTTVVGVIAGRLSVPLISERLFRRIIVAILVATALALLLSL
ncbi:MAG TPA: sulfite exporter TauE/SafE family protein [Afifellaceae bacterium]|nr:sulfite exporter TauE/SafE family protein [Afifellaceae bacterium]